jgi:hypothetical protein
VHVAQPAEGTIIFTESGVWRPEHGRDIRFSNVYRWTAGGESIRLEHLRFGDDHPVYLFDLGPVSEREWRSLSPHQCSEDCYAAVLTARDEDIILRWSVDGPTKQEVIEYTYSLANVGP